MPESQKQVASNPEQLHQLLEISHHQGHQRLGHHLLDAGLIQPEQLHRALILQHASQGRRLGEIMLEQGLLQAPDLEDVLHRQLEVPRAHLGSFEVDAEIVKQLPESSARRYHVMPMLLHGDALVLATESLLTQDALDSLRFVTQRKILQVLVDSGEVQQAIEEYYLHEVGGDDLQCYEKTIEPHEEEQRVWREAEQQAKQQPIVKLVDSMIRNAIVQKTSDIHILPGKETFLLQYRIDGTLVKVRDFPKTLLPPVVSRIKILSRLNIAERRLPQDGRLTYNQGGQEVDLRVSIIPMQFGESIVIRLLNKNAGLRRLSQIGFGEADEARLRDLLNRSHGIILVTGPTGSGKSTTLYAALQEVAKQNVNVITVEDPIEYELAGMRQIQLIPSINFSFPQALRAILRHDPDVVMIGEMRDLETCKIAVESALTGHLVFSTLHTNDAASTIVRLLEMGIEPYMIRAALIGVLAQRLVRKNCQHCLEPEEMTPLMRINLGLEDNETFYRGRGCEHCHNSGFSGRAAVYELLTLDEAIRNIIHHGSSSDEIRSLALQRGMTPMPQHGVALARQKLVSIAEVYRSCM